MKPEPVPATLSTPDFPNALTCDGALKTRSDLRVQKSRLLKWSMKIEEELTYRTSWCDPDDPHHRACSGEVRVHRTDEPDRFDIVPCACECHRRKS